MSSASPSLHPGVSPKSLGFKTSETPSEWGPPEGSLTKRGAPNRVAVNELKLSDHNSP